MHIAYSRSLSRSRLWSRRAALVGVLGVVGCVLAGLQPKVPGPALGRWSVLQATRELQRDVRAEHSSYRHKDASVKWVAMGQPAEAHADCSGLVNAILMRCGSLSAEQLGAWLGRARPVARDYHDAIVAQRGFRRVTSVSSLQPGFIIAIKYPKDAKDTGHVMVANSGALRRGATPPIVEGTTQWEIEVIDSTRSPHGRSDTRFVEGGSHRAGIGVGTIRLYADDKNQIVGYTWSTGRGSVYRPMSERPIVAGETMIGEKPPWEGEAKAGETDERTDDGEAGVEGE